MITIRVLSLAAVAIMLAVITFGFLSGDFSGEGSEIVGLAWGKVTLVDLYVGLAIFGAWVTARERHALKIAVWWVALIGLGNLAAAIYLSWAAFTCSDIRELLLGHRVSVETVGRHESL